MINIGKNSKDLTEILTTIKTAKNRDDLPIIKITLKRSFITFNVIILTLMIVIFSLMFAVAIFIPATETIFFISLIFLIFLFIYGIYREIKEQRLTLFYRNAHDPFYCELNPVSLIIVSGNHKQTLKWLEIKFVNRCITNRSTPAHIAIHSHHNIYLYHNQLPINYRKLFWVFHDYWLRANHRPIIKIL